jgi:hypothetical protein
MDTDIERLKMRIAQARLLRARVASETRFGQLRTKEQQIAEILDLDRLRMISVSSMRARLLYLGIPYDEVDLMIYENAA